MNDNIHYKRITAVITSLALAKVETALRDINVSGISVTQVRGYGEYHDYYQQDMMCNHAQIEIFCDESETDTIIQCIMDTAYTGQSGDGLVAVFPVDKLYRIRTKEAFDCCCPPCAIKD